MLADKVDAKWSGDSKSCLLLMKCEVEKTSELYLMDIFGVTSMVELEKEGPIYSAYWAPNKSQFIVVYGFVPAKATLFNKKCEPVFDFGSGAHCDIALFNSQGTLLLLGGFGNLEGNIEIWDIGGKKSVAKFEAPNTTDVKWSPDGQHIYTATCAPKFRMSNGFKIWHYTSTLLHETNYASPGGKELWEVTWKPDSEIRKSQFKILNKPLFGGIKRQQSHQESKSKSAMKNQKKQRKATKKKRKEEELDDLEEKSSSSSSSDRRISDQTNSDFGSDSNPELLSPPKIPAFFKLDPDLSDLGGSNSDFSDFGSDLDEIFPPKILCFKSDPDSATSDFELDPESELMIHQIKL